MQATVTGSFGDAAIVGALTLLGGFFGGREGSVMGNLPKDSITIIKEIA